VTKTSISNEEWNAGRTLDTIEARIIAVLKTEQNPLSIDRIVSGLGYNVKLKDLGSFISGIADYWVIQNALNKLVKEGTVEARTIKQRIGEQVYYKAV
jgi:hypothetical protein